MKFYSALLFSIIVAPVFAGEMADIKSPFYNNTYLAIGGGYYGFNDQANYTSYDYGVLSKQQSFNDSNTDGYGQIGLGANAQIGSLVFDHQLSIGKIGGGESFNTSDSSWNFSQSVDFGYDFMPKMNIFQNINGFAILGVHYARFIYQKKTSDSNATSFNTYKDQIGFNLGAGLTYQVNTNLDVLIKYQHWQYSAVQVNGINQSATKITIENFTPAYNLVGLELRYHIT